MTNDELSDQGFGLALSNTKITLTPKLTNEYFLQGFCPYGEHNRMADILFKTPEGGLHAMLHAPYGNYQSVLVNSWTHSLLAHPRLCAWGPPNDPNFLNFTKFFGNLGKIGVLIESPLPLLRKILDPPLTHVCMWIVSCVFHVVCNWLYWQHPEPLSPKFAVTYHEVGIVVSWDQQLRVSNKK